LCERQRLAYWIWMCLSRPTKCRYCRYPAAIRDVAMANIFWLCIYSVHIGATQRIRLNRRSCASAMRPDVKLLWPLVINLWLLNVWWSLILVVMYMLRFDIITVRQLWLERRHIFYIRWTAMNNQRRADSTTNRLSDFDVLNRITSGYATMVHGRGAIRIALRQTQTCKLRHCDVIDDVITRKL